MGRSIRFIVTDGEFSVAEIEAALKSFNESLVLRPNSESRFETASLLVGEKLCGEVELKRPHDGHFEDELAELQAEVEECGGPDEAVKTVSQLLRDATGMLTIQVNIGQGEGQLCQELDSLWSWLHSKREGLRHSDGEYHDGADLLLKV